MSEETEQTEPENPRQKLLEEKGVQVFYDKIWFGKVGEGRGNRPNYQHITDVFIPLTAEEWCYVCQRFATSVG